MDRASGSDTAAVGVGVTDFPLGFSTSSRPACAARMCFAADARQQGGDEMDLPCTPNLVGASTIRLRIVVSIERSGDTGFGYAFPHQRRSLAILRVSKEPGRWSQEAVTASRP